MMVGGELFWQETSNFRVPTAILRATTTTVLPKRQRAFACVRGQQQRYDASVEALQPPELLSGLRDKQDGSGLLLVSARDPRKKKLRTHTPPGVDLRTREQYQSVRHLGKLDCDCGIR